MSRNSIIFYKSFYDSAQLLGDKARLKLLDAILEAGFSCYENVTELEQNCAKIETKLVRFRNVFAQFSLIKPHILNSGKRYLNGKSGGAPLGNSNAKKQPKNKQLEREVEYKKEKEYSNREDNNDVKLYGEYSNVSLTKEQYGKLLAMCASEKPLNELIDSFSVNIEVGKERPYTAELPNAHFERLKSYYNYRKKNPDKFANKSRKDLWKEMAKEYEERRK